MWFDPLGDEHIDAGIGELLGFLSTLDAEQYRAMIVHALDRVHLDLGTGLAAPATDEESAWRRYIEPGLTTADADEVIRLVMMPETLKERTISLIQGIWDRIYAEDFEIRHAELIDAERAARSVSTRGFGMAFADLTGNRLPATLTVALNNVARVTFCPSAHIGAFVSYISYPPDLVVFFASQNVIDGNLATFELATPGDLLRDESYSSLDSDNLSGDVLLESLRALGDANRLRILDLLSGGELYAQEIVGRLGIAQSAVSRHLSQLERAGLVRVEPRRGMKYYAIDRGQMEALAESIRGRAK